LIILTEWDEFRIADFSKIKLLMKWNVIIDGRNIWNKWEMIGLGFVYEWIGR
jgi:UDPglucose 6-dehydrogenase